MNPGPLDVLNNVRGLYSLSAAAAAHNTTYITLERTQESYAVVTVPATGNTSSSLRMLVNL